MWVEGGDIHDELLDQLGGVLAPPEDLALTPSAAELEALAAAVAARWPEGVAAPAARDAVGSPEDTRAPASPVRPLRSGGRRPLRRLGSSAWRAGAVASGLVLVSGSAAAAANGGVPLPRPVRVVAYSVGLPVDSPALDDTNQHIKELKEAVKAQDKPKAEATVRRLRTDLAKVPADEKKEAVPKVEAAIVAANPLIQSPAPTTTTTVPPSSTTTAPAAPAPSTTATTAEEKEQEQEKPAATTTTTAPPTSTTTDSSTTTTTAPETEGTPSGEPGTGTGDGGSIGSDPGSTTSTTVPPDTTTTTSPPPEETTTTTTTSPTTTTTTSPPTQPTAEDQSQHGPAFSAASRQRRP